MGAAVESWNRNDAIKAQGRIDDGLLDVLRGIQQSFYADTPEGVTVIDKSRSWPNTRTMRTMAAVLGRPPKIIATVRSPAACAASFVRIAKPEDVEDFLQNSQMIHHLRHSYGTLGEGWHAAPENFCIVDYDDLMDNPSAELHRIHDFLGLPPFQYDLDHIDGSTVAEDDKVWKTPGLHDVAPKLARQHQTSPGVEYRQFNWPQFWRPTPADSTPDLLDLQLAASQRGDWEEGTRLVNLLEEQRPECHRAAFNRGWYRLREGELQEGFQLMNRGRNENVFGDGVASQAPIWNGETGAIVLLSLEGGFGDQIWAIRFVTQLVEDHQCKVIVACDPALAPMFSKLYGVSAIIANQGGSYAYHTHWLPSFYAPIPLEMSYETLSGKPYLSKEFNLHPRTFRIGLRWQGNPACEDVLKRIFPPELLFGAVRRAYPEAEFVCLQRDEGAQHKPDWIKDVCLDTWEDTQEAISECDLVISSCTSVAHLAAAMGVDTWIITPIMPYFLWAEPGPWTKWYDSVRLFRQTKPETWLEPFEEIEAELSRYRDQC